MAKWGSSKWGQSKWGPGETVNYSLNIKADYDVSIISDEVTGDKVFKWGKPLVFKYDIITKGGTENG